MYSEDWEIIAGRIKDLAGWQCQKCGRPHDPQWGYTLTVHHISADIDDNRDENLVALCQRCHLSVQPRASRVRFGQMALF